MGRRLGAVLIALGVVCVLLAFCLDASAIDTGDVSVCQRTRLAGRGFSDTVQGGGFRNRSE